MPTVGDAETFTATFANAAGTATDPTAVTLEIRNPIGTVTTYTYSLGEITKSSTGVYTKTITYDRSGQWLYEWQGTGTVPIVANGTRNVNPQAI